MTSALEKVARAIEESNLKLSTDTTGPDGYAALALAALAALLNPDEGTVEAMARSAAEPGHSATNEQWLAHIFNAAISHLTSEQGRVIEP